MNSPYRVHPALPLPAAQAVGNTIPFPAAHLRTQASPIEKPAPMAPRKVPAPEPPNKLQRLVQVEGDIRKLPSFAALAFHAVNETRDLLNYEQAFFFRSNNRRGFALEFASNVASVDLRAPLVLTLTRAINRLAAPEKPLAFPLRETTKNLQLKYEHGLWLPLIDRTGKIFAGILLARVATFSDTDKTIANRLAETYAHAFRALTPPRLLRSLSLPTWALYGLPLSSLLLAIIPVPMTALAPFEVVAHQPRIIAASIDGAIKDMLVDPNTSVEEGTVLFHLDATVQSAELAIAAQKVAVAESRLATTRNGAFTDKDMKRSLGVAEKELQLAKAEYEFRLSLLQKTEVKASASGLLVYSSKNDWIGKPVRVGEKVMEIANPERIEYRIALPVQDSIVMQDGAAVRLFLDAEPLSPKSASIAEMSYHAVEASDGSMSYVIRALPSQDEAAQRIGLRGTAQISGDYVPLGFYVLRRPIAALRQYFGI